MKSPENLVVQANSDVVAAIPPAEGQQRMQQAARILATGAIRAAMQMRLAASTERTNPSRPTAKPAKRATSVKLDSSPKHDSADELKGGDQHHEKA